MAVRVKKNSSNSDSEPAALPEFATVTPAIDEKRGRARHWMTSCRRIISFATRMAALNASGRNFCKIRWSGMSSGIGEGLTRATLSDSPILSGGSCPSAWLLGRGVWVVQHHLAQLCCLHGSSQIACRAGGHRRKPANPWHS